MTNLVPLSSTLLAGYRINEPSIRLGIAFQAIWPPIPRHERRPGLSEAASAGMRLDWARCRNSPVSPA